MKRLVLCRHAKTETIYLGITDEQRELMPRGRTDAQLVAADLEEKGYKPQLMISSDAARAVQTAQIVAQTVGYPVEAIRYEHFIYHGYTTQDFLDFLATLDDAVDNVWVVGHNPDIAMLAMRLAPGDFSRYPTSAVSVIAFDTLSWRDIEPKSGVLEYFMVPKLLKG
ncbi:MAG: histidine phosphatase family protein [Breznakibacter sp.]